MKKLKRMDRVLENKWYYGLLNSNGYSMFDDYDVYYTNGPSSGVGNGLGGRATAAQLEYYDTLLYTSGDLSAFTLSNGDFVTDPSQDIAVLDAWLASGDKNAFFTGNDLAYDLHNGGVAGATFLSDWIGVEYESRSVQPYIGNQHSPTVRIIEDNPVWYSVEEWLASGSGCR